VTLPDWLEPLYDAPTMRATDAWAIEGQGVPSLELMERAGEGVAALAGKLAPGGPIVVVAGKGNNGGDGLVAARLLRDGGREVEVLFAGEPEGTGDARTNLERLPGDPPRALAGPIRPDAALVIDALLGTGATGKPHGAVGEAIDAIAACGAAVLAADVPSGVDASTGEVAGRAVSARATATFHAAKPGLWIAPGKQHAGHVHVIPIGIPAGAPAPVNVGLIRDETLLARLPRREAGATKFTSGQVLVAGGSPGLTGAPCMAALAAQRAGAGYVTVCAPSSLSLVFETRLLEVMTIALADAEGSLTVEGVPRLLQAAERGGALVLGPGAGRSDATVGFVRTVLSQVELPAVLDADGLSAYAGELARLAEDRRGAPLVLTPHEGELGRLLGVPSSEVAAARLAHAREAARQAAAVVVLKGDDTLIAHPSGLVAVSSGATAALATAGTGDVLSGVIGALLAARVEPFVAAAAGVRLHALAGIHAADRHGRDGMIASDVIEQLAAVRTR
jgi:NAD(P)H-hydrate epimerase